MTIDFARQFQFAFPCRVNALLLCSLVQHLHGNFIQEWVGRFIRIEIILRLFLGKSGLFDEVTA